MNETRFMGDLLGSYVLASRALQTEGPMLLACRARSISSREAVLCAPAGTERTIFVGPDGQEVPAPDSGQGVCVVCTGL